MSKNKNKSKNYISIFLVISLLFSMLLMTSSNFVWKEANAANKSGPINKKVVNGFTNMSNIGESPKGSRNNNLISNIGGKEQITCTVLDTATVEKLVSEGFSREKINNAKMLVERVVFQLKEITADNENIKNALLPGNGVDAPDNEELSRYYDLSAKINLSTAVYLMLKLENMFGSLESVLDEYLYCLQVGIDLEQCLIDKNAYEKEKQQKSIGIDPEKIITLSKIESKLVDKISNTNTNNKNIPEIKPAIQGEIKNNSTAPILNDMHNPELVLPSTKPAIPKNPTEDIMQEIKNINKQSLY